LDGDGYLDAREVQSACQKAGVSDNYDDIRGVLKQVGTSATNKIDAEEFVEVSEAYFSGKGWFGKRRLA
jgi:Ca2+-binding EF-hand superfamily protein